uniref:FHA domain-containing protein n=1 Tax=Candidatus Kentrum sp. FM TaxID=2126340 RepID=A0A450RVE4_9GAMM|nr:MAG: hypothetical protein BECKFM1743A_GA0114220_1000415 [Candidatus Kentron sp. FM]VFJ43929.1 MAG: hypothetical protein BECKFM1743C_GA0114222_100064 [Candidatus Kentron sp. FM]VFK07345.1 MAG: hypothetical protein BECKFM1743B_GA0114221_100388 [Candidatus Kentron sp. FM]
MAIAIRCDKGHFYDPDKHSGCPLCGVPEIELDEGMLRRSSALELDGKTIMKEPDPVVGWLVCTEGPDKGRDYRLLAGRNTIGRGREVDIALTDDGLSRQRHGIVLHDPVNDNFYLLPGTAKGQDPVYYRGEAVLAPTELAPYDSFRLGDTTLLFVPLCGPRFQWGDKTDDRGGPQPGRVELQPARAEP